MKKSLLLLAFVPLVSSFPDGCRDPWPGESIELILSQKKCDCTPAAFE